MKQFLTYGLLIAFAGAVLMLCLFFSGLHGERYELGKWVGMVGILFPIIGIPLGIRAWRDQAGKGTMSYGRGLVAGIMISLWSGVGSAVFILIYGMVINPNFQEVMVQHEMAKIESRPMPEGAAELAEKVMRFTTHPAAMSVFSVFNALIFGLIIALIASAFLKREAPAIAQPPPIA